MVRCLPPRAGDTGLDSCFPRVESYQRHNGGSQVAALALANGMVGPVSVNWLVKTDKSDLQLL